MSRIRRLVRIVWTIAKYRLDEVARSVVPESRLVRLSPLALLPKPTRSPAERLRLAIEDLGPIFVKFGQILSTRRDLLPTDYADELAKLQDRVPPFPAQAAIARIEESRRYWSAFPATRAGCASKPWSPTTSETSSAS